MNQTYLITILVILLIFSVINNILMYYRNYDRYTLTVNRLANSLPKNIDHSVFIYFYDTDTDIKDKLIKMNKDRPYKVASYEFHNSEVIFNKGDIYDITSQVS